MNGDYNDDSSSRPSSGHQDQDSGHQGSGQRGGGPYGGGGRGRYGGGGGGGGGGRRYDQSGRSDRPQRKGIPLSELDPATTDASRKAIGASIEVHRALGPGYSSAVYIAAVCMELDALGVPYKTHHSLPVMYKDRQVGTAIAPMFVEDRFILEIMARPGPVTTSERLALRAQLKAANVDLGLIINFAERKLKDGLVRVVNVEKITRERGISFDEHDDSHDSHDVEPRD